MDIRICYVVNSVSETSVPATIATALIDNQDISVDILAWFEAEPFEGDDRVSVTCLDAPYTVTGIDWETYRQARNHLEDYDLIQAHHPHSGTFAKLIGARLGIPLVSREGNTRDGFTRKGRIANGLTNVLADRIVPNSRAVYESFTHWERLLVDDDHVEIIPNGVDLDRIDKARQSDYDLRATLDIPTDTIVVGTTSVITEQKALDVLIKGIAQANDQTDPRLDLVVAGDGPQRSKLGALARRLDIEQQVHFIGMVDREMVYRILAEIDIYAMPSRWEGFSNAAVEALGAVNPCVFSDIDPFLLPYRNVSLFHDLNDVEDLTDKLVTLSTDEEMRDMYARNSRKLVEQKYTIEMIAEQYVKLYSDIICR